MSKIRKENLSFISGNSVVDSKLDNDLLFENFIAPEYVNTGFAARLLGISENALRIKVCRGKIPAYKFGRCLRFKMSEINNLFLPKE
ncbi:MAG: helix-turn-helix domain-containing protein [Bdellovibrionales bacterium]|nr:helix-turn-helix domain-containing protein [Bdellovibrionales bacterium]